MIQNILDTNKKKANNPIRNIGNVQAGNSQKRKIEWLRNMLLFTN